MCITSLVHVKFRFLVQNGYYGNDATSRHVFEYTFLSKVGKKEWITILPRAHLTKMYKSVQAI